MPPPRLDLATIKKLAAAINNPNLREFLITGWEIFFDTGDNTQLKHALSVHSFPVDVEEFMFGSRFLGRPKDEIYPAVMEELWQINEENGRLRNRLTEFVGTGGIGSAKCLGRDTPILMFDGTIKAVQDVQVGDLLMGPDSRFRRVVSLASGIDQLYRVDQKAGMPYVVNSEHILSLQYTDTSNGTKPSRYSARKGDVRNLSVQEYLALPSRHRALLKGWRPREVTFSPTYVSDPYLLGLWLGDGTSASASFTSMDKEIVQYLQSIATRDGLVLSVLEDPRGNKAKRHTFRGERGQGNNRVRSWLQSYGLLNNKHIPMAYLTSSAENRLQLLAGLLDTDGSLSGNVYVISQKRKHLAEGICFLAQSLGFTATQRAELHPNGTVYYRTFISGPTDAIPVRLPYKKAAPRKQGKDVTRWGITVTAIGEGEYFGFELEGPDRLFLLGDFTATHNTTTALYTNAYQLYLLSCYKNPHQTFGMDSTSEILFIFQSMNATLAKDVDYKRFREICRQSYYYTTVFPFNKDFLSTLVFPNRIEVKPMGADGGSIGQNVLGGLIDEVNFMEVTEKSKKRVGGGTYDQAKVIYDSVSRRIKSRFADNGGMPGILCLVSSKNYPGEFTDVKLREAATDPTIYIYDKRVWDIKPAGTFSPERFPVFVGDETRKPRILTAIEDVPASDRSLVVSIPVDFRKQFERDLIGCLRDIAGVGTAARFPYILNVEAMNSCFGTVPSILSKQEHSFNDDEPLRILPSQFREPEKPRWVHIDLGLTGDSAGVSCGYVAGFKARKESLSKEEVMPEIVFDFVLRVTPPRGDEIKFYKIRDLIYKLRELGLNIKWVSFDSFQSVDSLQILRSQGFSTGYVNVDTDMMPYEYTKAALYSGCLKLPEHSTAKKEFTQLERVAAKNRVDHPPSGSKDCTDSISGVVFGLTTRREVWGLYGIPMVRIPDNVKLNQQRVEGDTRVEQVK